MTKRKWGSLGKSVRGADHRLSGLPNQDALRICCESDKERMIMAVADGHGSPIHFRSGTGSQIAVDTAVDILSSKFKNSELREVKSYVSDIPGLISKAWNKRITLHHEKNEFSSDELALLEDQVWDKDFLEPVRLNARIAYGTTLLVVAINASVILYMQVGDGDILVVDANGHTRKPLPDDVQYSRYQTKSLCSEGAELDFRITVEDIDEINPALVIASTDGYSNSFRNSADFSKVGIAYRDLLRIIGPRFLQAILGNLLFRTSSSGSGDDISLSLAYRSDVIEGNGLIFP